MKTPTKDCTDIPTLLEYAKEQRKLGRAEREEEILELEKRLLYVLIAYSDLCHKDSLVDFYAVLDIEIEELREQIKEQEK